MNDKTVDLNQELLTKNACIYSNERRKLSESLLRGIDGVSEVTSDGGFFRRPTFLRMRVGGEQVQLNATFDRQKIKVHAEGMHGWVNRIHEISPLMNLHVFHQFIDQINQMYGVQVDSEFNFQSPVWKALLRIAEPIEGVVFVHNSFVDCDGRVLFGYLADLVNEIRSGGRSGDIVHNS
jgi:hypothetical protein